MNNYNKLIKIIVIGNANVGKTSLCHKIINYEVPLEYNSTIGVDYYSTIIDNNKNKIKLNIWDTAGQERFFSISKPFYRSAQLVIYMFSYNDYLSFVNLDKWRKEVETYCPSGYCELIIGNKIDLKNVVLKKEVELYCKEKNIRLINSNLKIHNIQNEIFSFIHNNFDNDERFNSSNYTKNIYIKNYNEDNKKCCSIL